MSQPPGHQTLIRSLITDHGAVRLAGYMSFVMLGWNVVLIPSCIRSIQSTFHQADAAFGLYFFVSALLYAAGSLTGGLLTERFGRNVVLPLGAFLIGSAQVATSQTPVWTGMLAAVVFSGWGSGAMDGGINGLFMDLYSHARGAAMNAIHLFFSIGALIAPLALGWLLASKVGWRSIVLATGLCWIALASLLAIVGLPQGRRTAARGTDALGRGEARLLPFVALAAGIALYVGAEIGVSNWMVRFLSNIPINQATLVLSGFWAGLSLGRLLSNWLAERIDYRTFTVTSFSLAGVSIIGAATLPLPLSAILFALAGLFCGPIYPMIMAIAGNIYPHRLAALSGTLAAAAVVGSLLYPPLMGLMAQRLGLQVGMVGAGVLALAGAFAVALTRFGTDKASKELEVGAKPRPVAP